MSIAEKWNAERDAMKLPELYSWDQCITQHLEREPQPEAFRGSPTDDRKIEGFHARKWTKKKNRRS